MDSSREWQREQDFDALKREVADLNKRLAYLERELAWAINTPKSETVSHLPAAPLMTDDDGA